MKPRKNDKNVLHYYVVWSSYHAYRSDGEGLPGCFTALTYALICNCCIATGEIPRAPTEATAHDEAF